MARIRTIKPEFFVHEALADLDHESGLPCRLAFIGLWCQCDREGRFKWRPRSLKTQIMPFDDVDFDEILKALANAGFITKYVVDGEEFGLVAAFVEHQKPHVREAESTIPTPSPEKVVLGHRLSLEKVVLGHRLSTEKAFMSDNLAPGEGKGREGKGREGDGAKAPPSGVKIFLTYPTKSRKTFELPESQVGEWERRYRRVDVRAELRGCRDYLERKPREKKDHGDMLDWLTACLCKANKEAAGDPTAELRELDKLRARMESKSAPVAAAERSPPSEGSGSSGK